MGKSHRRTIDFLRGKIESDENNSEINVGVFDLLNVFQKILAKHKEDVLMEIEREEMSLADMLAKMHDYLKSTRQVNVTEFLHKQEHGANLF